MILQLTVPRFRCFQMNKKVIRDALLMVGVHLILFHLENIGMLQLILKANLKNVVSCVLVGVLKAVHSNFASSRKISSNYY